MSTELTRCTRARELLLNPLWCEKDARALFEMALRNRMTAEDRESLCTRVFVNESRRTSSSVPLRMRVNDVFNIQADLGRFVRVGCFGKKIAG